MGMPPSIDFETDFGRKAARLIQRSHVAWLTTVDSTLTPQPRPVWFIWDAKSFLIFSKPDAHKLKHLRDHPRAALHFNTDKTGDEDVIVFVGPAAIDAQAAPAHEVREYLSKYKGGMEALGLKPEEFSLEYSVAVRLIPDSMRGW